MTAPFAPALGRGDMLALCPGCLSPWERESSILCLRRWMGLKASREYNSTFGLETISDRYWIVVNVDHVPI
jgi:hypothetical protein